MRRTGLSVVECGHCRQIGAATMRGAPWRIVEFPSLVGVIRHPTEGVVLFDTGYDPAFLAATRRLPERIYRWATPVTIPSGTSIADRLADLGIPIGDVRHVVISHFHGDHVSGLHHFPHARVHCARAGLEDARGHGRLSGTRRGILPALVPTGIETAFFEDDALVALPRAFAPFHAGADVLGDGSLIAVDLPGHCPGHRGLALRLEDDRWTMLVADAAWSIEAIRRNAPPPVLTSSMLGDAREARRTLGALHDMHGRDDLVLLPSHCRAASRDAGLLT